MEVARSNLAGEHPLLEVLHAVGAHRGSVDVNASDPDIEPGVAIDEVIAAAAFNAVAAGAAEDDVAGAERGHKPTQQTIE